MKPLVIYHANCADGFGAAFAAWLKFGDEAIYLPTQYGDDLKHITEIAATNCDVYILDFSFPKEVMEIIFRNAKQVVWLDHHKTAFEMYGLPLDKRHEEIADRDLPEYGFMPYHRSHVSILDNNKSGAMIAWEYFHPDKEIPMLIKHIDDYDRWVFALEGTKEFNKALWSYAPWSFVQWRNFFCPVPANWKDWKISAMYQEGAAILRAHDQNVQAVVGKAARKCKIDDTNYDHNEMPWWEGLAANCPPHLVSDVGHQLANQSKTYGLLWYINKEGKCLCSLRSNGNYDVSAIAKAFGGGGHKNAAGFEIDIQTLLEWIK